MTHQKIQHKVEPFLESAKKYPESTDPLHTSSKFVVNQVIGTFLFSH